MNAIRNNRLTVVFIPDKGEPAMFVVAGEEARPAALRPGDTRLVPGEVLSLARMGQTLRVVSGSAWITFDGEDTVLLAGQSMVLEPGPDAAVVSALADEPLVYHIYEGPGT